MTQPQSGKRVIAEKSFSMKDRLFNARTVKLLATGLKRAQPQFRAAAYEKAVLAQFGKLELKACIECMADTLVDYLPGDYRKSVAVLKRALPVPLDPGLSDDDFGEFIWAVPSEFAARQGCTKKRLNTSLSLLRQTTQRFSAEFAIRPFLKSFPEETYTFLERCAEDRNYHVRRLASEGTRPNLPWGLGIDLSVDKTIAMLDRLYADPTRFVTRSVANSLNDVSKKDPQRVLTTLKGWAKTGQQNQEELDWITRHALRSLIKTDHAQALSLLGYPPKPRFTLTSVKCSKIVQIGDSLSWGASLTSLAAQKLKLVLRVYFLKSNGTHSPKVFALKDLSMEKGEMVQLHKKLTFKAMTTRALYLGEHRIELVVNGVAGGESSFVLED